MGFLKKKTKYNPNINRLPFYKKKGWRIFFLCFLLVLIFCASFVGYLVATGAKIFDNSLTSSSLIKAIKGEGSDLPERVNVLLLGRGGDSHPGGLLTDSLEVVSIDTKNKKIALISTPRDLYVPINGHSKGKINSAFAAGYNDYLSKSCKSKKKSDCKDAALSAGANLTRETVSNVFGIDLQYYVMLDFDGFEEFIDEIGGVDVNVAKTIYDPYFPAEDMLHYTTFKLSAGQHHMDGATALKYARSRETTSDFDRSKRQQQIISAVKEKVMTLGFLANPKKITNVISTISGHLKTNLSPSDITSLANIVKDMNSNEIITKVFDTESGSPLVGDSSTGTYYIKTKTGDFSALQKIVKNIFSTETTIEDENATISVQNGSITSGLGGKLGDILTKAGLTVSNITTASTKASATAIYDYSSGKKSKTIKYLENGLGVKAVQKTKTANISYDIAIIIGNNYDGFNTSTDNSTRD